MTATTDKPTDRYPDSEGPFAGKNNTFPIGTAARVKNAWARIHQGPTIANHTAAEIEDIKAKIKARAKELGIELEDHAAPTDNSVGDLERCFTGGSVELRSGSGSRTIGGYAATFGTVSRRLSFGHERIAPSFFDESKRANFPDVVARLNHDSFHLLGSTFGKTLRLSVDGIGLDYSCDVPETRSGDDVLMLVQRQDIHSSSFAFNEAKDEWTFRDGQPLRTLLSGHLYDVAPISGELAAYPNTSATLRSLARYVHAPVEDVEALAAQGELRRLFERTDRPTLTTAQAGARLDELAIPRHVARDHAYREAILRLHARRAAWA